MFHLLVPNEKFSEILLGIFDHVLVFEFEAIFTDESLGLWCIHISDLLKQFATVETDVVLWLETDFGRYVHIKGFGECKKEFHFLIRAHRLAEYFLIRHSSIDCCPHLRMGFDCYDYLVSPMLEGLLVGGNVLGQLRKNEYLVRVDGFDDFC